MNLQPKKTPNEYRLIHNLTYPYDDNANIPQQEKTVTYAFVGTAITKLLRLPAGAYMCKTDIKDAYKLIPIHKDDHNKLGIYFEGHYYYQKTLPQGCGSSCAIFEMFSTALGAIFNATVPDSFTVHLIDDFLLLLFQQRSADCI